MSDNNSLVGHFLIASPSLKDPNFEKTVTLVCEQSESGSLGLIINKPLHHNLDEIITEMNLDQLDSSKVSFLQGGPVGLDRGFVIQAFGKILLKSMKKLLSQAQEISSMISLKAKDPLIQYLSSVTPDGVQDNWKQN